jgi:hypothetical protein
MSNKKLGLLVSLVGLLMMLVVAWQWAFHILT